MEFSRLNQMSEELEVLGTQGISTEAIEQLLLNISESQDQVLLGDQESWDKLEALRIRWSEKLQKLESYFER